MTGRAPLRVAATLEQCWHAVPGVMVAVFGFGMLIQYRLYSDPEYNARNKAAAREQKMEALRMRYIMENYDPLKKQMMGLPPTPAQPIDIDQLPKKESSYSLWNAITFYEGEPC